MTEEEKFNRVWIIVVIIAFIGLFLLCTVTKPQDTIRRDCKNKVSTVIQIKQDTTNCPCDSIIL